ncbi:beta-1,6-N-acetylglucosaminyltransferase [Uliginosibacterium sp. H1]|uniref:beta-1,6-N-acetylglucosaminyltransferase n=1 Tax=Uliginosibacterium sp. H1 TaxID=3114757 RepID=UPI002E178A4D|nr:beta-1,6-N-acetylglucosaminyltransferase [Uliginosibacterium sp. H1]
MTGLSPVPGRGDESRYPDQAPDHVVVLMVFQKPDQVVWLIELLLRLGAAVVVHVDAKHVERFIGLGQRFAGDPRVHVLDRSVRVNWGGFSQVRATLLGIQAALDRFSGFRYLHLMSGECLPLMDFASMGARIEALPPDADFIESEHKSGYAWRINRYNILGEHPRNRAHWHNLAFKKLRDAQKPFPPRRNFDVSEIRIGSTWWSLRASSVHAMWEQAGDMEDFCHRFRWTRCSDEHFFQILHYRAGRVPAGSARKVRFPPGVASPAYLSLVEVQQALAEGCLFARKVEADVAARYWQDETARTGQGLVTTP